MRLELRRFLTLLAVAAPALGGCGGDERPASGARAQGDLRPGTAVVTRGPGNDRNPKWSPDGKQIAFSSGRDGNEEIYVVGADGKGLQRLTDHPAEDRNPAWSPDGRYLAFDTRRWGPHPMGDPRRRR